MTSTNPDVACFPAFGTCHKFSRGFGRWYVFTLIFIGLNQLLNYEDLQRQRRGSQV